MFHQVDEIPILGSGKLALSEVRDMASSIWGDDSADND
jgi:hypothetical protein